MKEEEEVKWRGPSAEKSEGRDTVKAERWMHLFEQRFNKEANECATT